MRNVIPKRKRHRVSVWNRLQCALWGHHEGHCLGDQNVTVRVSTALPTFKLVWCYRCGTVYLQETKEIFS